MDLGGNMKPESTKMYIDKELLANAEPILKKQGLTASEAITIFLNTVVAKKGMPIQTRQHDLTDAATREEKLAKIISLSGKYTTLTPTDDFARQKQLEIDLEERKFSR
jgi:addiction module RelB/DinJ family antitoxin